MAAILNGSSGQKPYTLTVTPVDFSLTAGTDIPTPPRSPVKEALPAAPGGPLSSHPTTPEKKVPGAYPSSEHESESPPLSQTKATMRNSTVEQSPSPQAMRRQSGMRRMLSLSNLRTSFSSSRTSLALPRPSIDRPSTSTYNDRPFTPSMSSTASGSPAQPTRTLSRKRSGGSWFKRKSSLFMMNHDGTLDAVDEDGTYDSRGNKRLRSAYSLPVLPEISELGGGDLDGGDLAWDSSVFKRV